MKVIIEEYSPLWSQQFLGEQLLIKNTLHSIEASIDHIGSTSIKGLAAKPKIDILVGVNNQNDLDATVPLMIDAGYTYFQLYEEAMSYRRFFVKLKPIISTAAIPQRIIKGEKFVDGEQFRSVVHIHTIEKKSEHWLRHIAFRDYVRTHEDVKLEYAQLKLRLSTLEFKDGTEYNSYKNEFMKATEKRAVDWYHSNIKKGS